VAGRTGKALARCRYGCPIPPRGGEEGSRLLHERFSRSHMPLRHFGPPKAASRSPTASRAAAQGTNRKQRSPPSHRTTYAATSFNCSSRGGLSVATTCAGPDSRTPLRRSITPATLVVSLGFRPRLSPTTWRRPKGSAVRKLDGHRPEPPRRADGRMPTLRRSSILRARIFVQPSRRVTGENPEPRPSRSGRCPSARRTGFCPT
jgi:hypothetical protein